MTPIESRALAEVMFWYAVIMIIFAIGCVVICRIFDAMDATPEEIAAREAERIAKQATKEYKRRQRMRAVRFWNF